MSDENFYCVSQDIREPSEERKSPPRLDESLRPCVCCGKPSVNRWCSTSCFISEDGYDEEAWK